MATNYQQLSMQIKQWGLELGLQQIGICDIDLAQAEQQLQQWLAKGYHGNMEYMQRHGSLRSHPEELLPGAKTVIAARLDYLPPNANIKKTLMDKTKAFVSRYAVGRDYHKLLRKRLQKLADKITQEYGTFNYRCFTDSAPVMEKPLAAKAGLGWQGKHTNLINKKAGSWFFLGTMYTDLPLILDSPVADHCGRCSACITVCPTQAIIAPYQLDARRCISYLTIELRESIPVEFRKLIGNRIYGCDDCQMVCPWNRFAKITQEDDFYARNNLDTLDLISAFNWTETQFLKYTEGSAIRRIGYQCWLRNVAVGLGNAPRSDAIIKALNAQLGNHSEMVDEHILWALEQHNLNS
jgi:epoxyqueuosine reductase